MYLCKPGSVISLFLFVWLVVWGSFFCLFLCSCSVSFRNPMMDCLIDSKCEALTVGLSATEALKQTRTMVYDIPIELDQHPNFKTLKHEYHDLKNPDQDLHSTPNSSGGAEDHPDKPEVAMLNAYDDPTELVLHGLVGTYIRNELL